MSDRALRIMLFPDCGKYSHRVTPLNEYFTDPSNESIYWIINNFKRNSSIEGKRAYGHEFYGDIIIKKSGIIREIRHYDQIEIWDLETETPYFWLLDDGFTPYGTWKFYRPNQSLKKLVKYYAEINGNSIDMIRETEKYNKHGEMRKTRKKIIKSVSRIN